MAIALAGTPAHTYGTLATGTVSKTATAPTGIALNDYLLMVVASHSSSTPSTVTTPTGWTLIGSVIGGQDTYVFGKVAVAGDVGAANYTVTFGGGTGTNNFEVSITRFTGVDPTTPLDAAAATVDTGYSGSTATQTMTLPAVTTATANAWQIAVVSMDDSASTMVTWAMATGFTQADVGSSISFKTAYRAEATAGSTGTSTWAWTGSYSGNDLQGVSFALRPAAASTGPTAPTFVAHYGTGTATTSETTASYATSVTVAAGDLLVCCVATGNSNWYGNPPTGGSGLSWTTGPAINAAGSAGAFTYWAIAQTAGTYTLTMTPGGSSTSSRAMVVDYLRFSGASGVGATVSTAAGGSAPSLNITTTQANSDIVMVISDYNAVTGARTYRTGAGTFTETAGANSGDGTTDGRVGYYGAGVTTAATYTVGATAPTGEAPAMVALEILGLSGGGGGGTSGAVTPPTLVAKYIPSGETNAYTGTVTTTASVTTQPGDVLIVEYTTNNGNAQATAPTGSTHLTWTQVCKNTNGSYGGIGVWTATATVAETFTMSMTGTGMGYIQWMCYRFSGSSGIGVTAYNQSAGSAPSMTVVTQQDHSTLVFIDSEYNAVAVSPRTWNTSVGTPVEDFVGNQGTSITGFISHYPDSGTAGSKTVGMSAPTGQIPAVCVVEVMGTASSGGGGGPTSVTDLVRGTDNQNSGASTATGIFITLNAPAGIQAGDPVVVGIELREPQSSLGGWRAPTGFTLIGETQSTGSGYLYYGIYGQNGLTGSTFTFDNGAGNTTSSRWAASMVVLNGTYAGAYQAGALQVATGATTVASPAITTTAPSYMVGMAGSRLSGGATWTWPAGWTEEGDTDPLASTNSAGNSSAVNNTLPSPAGTYSVSPVASAAVTNGYAGIVAFTAKATSQNYTQTPAENVGIGDYPVVTGSMVKAAVAGSTLAEFTGAQNTGSITLNTPAGTQPGDLLIAVFAADAVLTWSLPDVPAGWTRVGVAVEDVYGPYVDVMVMPVTSTPATSYTFSRSSGLVLSAAMLRVTNADLSNPIAQPATLWEPGISFYGASVTVPDESIMQPNTLVITAASQSATGASSMVPPANYTTVLANTGSGNFLNIASRFQALPGQNGLDTWTTSATTSCFGFVRLYINSAGSYPTQMQHVGITGTPTVAEVGVGNTQVTATTPTGAAAGEVLLALLAQHSDSGPPYYPSGGWIRTGSRNTVDTQTVALDSVSGGAGTSGTGTATSVSFTHTVSATATQRFLVVGVAIGTSGTTNTTVNVTCNGTAMAAYGAVTVGASGTAANGQFSQAFVMPNCPSGALNIVVTTSTAVVINAGSVVFTGVDTANPYGNAYYEYSGGATTLTASVTAGQAPSGGALVLVSAQSQSVTGATSPGVLDVHRASTTSYKGGNLAIGHLASTGAAQSLVLRAAASASWGGLLMALNPAPATTNLSSFYLPLTGAPNPSYTFYIEDGPATLILARVTGAPKSSPLEWPIREDWSTSGASQLTNLVDISAWEPNTQHVIAIAQSATGSAATLSTVPPDVTILAQNSGIGKKLVLATRSVAAANAAMSTSDLYQDTQAVSAFWAFLYLVFRPGQVYQTNYTPTPADAENITDAVVTAAGYVKAASESVGITDAIAISITRTVADTIGITDTGSGGAIYAPTPADAVGVTDAVSFAQTEHPAAGPDTVGITDTVTYSWGWGPLTADSVGITDAVSFVQTQSISVNDNIGAVDTGTGGTLFLPMPNDAVPITDTITGVVQTMHPAVADAVGITDAVSFALTSFHTVADNIGATDAPALARGVNPADNIGATDAILKSTGQYVSVADSIGATDTTSHVVGDTVSDSVPITETITTKYVIGRNPAENIGITDAIIISQNNKRTLAETIGVTDASAPFGNLSIVTSTTADPDIDIVDPGVILEDVIRLHGSPIIDIGITADLEKGPQRAAFDIGMSASLTHVTGISAEVDTEISMDPAPQLLVVGRMTDIVVAQHVGVIMPMSLRNGPVYADNTTTLLSDDFSSVRNDLWTYHLGASVSGGRGIFSYGWVVGTAPVAPNGMIGTSTAVQLVSTTVSDDWWLVLQNGQVGNYWLGWNTMNGSLSVTYVDQGGNEQRPFVTPYDPVAHAWLRVREAAGTVYFETSTNGVSWVPKWSAPTSTFTWDLTTATVWLGVDSNNGGTTILDNFTVVYNGLGAAASGGPQPYLGPTDKPVWRMTRNLAVPPGWGSYIAADLFDDIPAGSTLTLSVWVRANAGDAISFDILTDPAQFRPATGFPDNSMVGTGAWRQYTKTFTLTDDWVANFQRLRSSVQTWIEWSDATVQLTAPRAMKETTDPEPAPPEPPKYNRVFTVLR